MTGKFESPVALLIFNRPEHTRKVFQAIRAAKPKRLFIIADGPRNEKERALCEETRKITENVDWDCEVERKYSEVNLGCDPCTTAGITWILSKVDRITFLEDDCVPHQDFFPYCAELLEKYKDDMRVMTVSGDNFHQKNPNFSCPESYYFATVPFMHGFGLWSHKWKLYDAELATWPEVKRRGSLESVFPDHAVRAHFSYKYDQYHDKKLPNWDGIWAYSCVVNHGLCAVPKVNLVTNIGYGENATHPVSADDHKAELPLQALPGPLVHPKVVMSNAKNDQYTYLNVFGVNSTFPKKIVSYTRYHLPVLYSAFKRVVGS